MWRSQWFSSGHVCAYCMCWCSGPSKYHRYDDDDTQELFGLGPSVIEDKPFSIDHDVPSHCKDDTKSDGLYDKCNSISDNLLDELFSWQSIIILF